ncbi:Flp pilus assembly complex ATPase component TadA [bacterium]|nr:Flp pilus assembly complex ATPase component TadA [bacterium]MCB1222116.1 Flp pilus assembly complex ATPase component TadA [bacterium]UNM09869.1 MAG: Flp pilus assembly complex ATPase component TadA [Planctomycetales bacterium]
MQKKLGEMLVDSKVITLEQLQEALEAQRESGKRLGEVVIEMQMTTEDEVQSVLAEQLGIQQIDLYEEKIDTDVARLISADMITRHQAMPVRQEGNNVIVAMVDPLNLLAIDDIRLSTGLDVVPRICSPHGMKFAYDQLFGVTAEAEKHMEDFRQEQIKKGYVIDDTLADKATMAEVEQAPIVKLVDTVLTGAVDHGASDIHIEPKEDHAVVRYRVDGMLHKILTIPRHAVAAATARLKIMARCDTSERRKPQDGRIELDIRDAMFDIRFSVCPTINGEKIVMRLLNKSSADFKLTDLGFDEDELAGFNEILAKPHGIMLITGPTGSGKSTTLIASLGKMANETVNVMTVEDPVEYQLDKINQVHVNNKVGLNFATALRTFMRQDPDIIMVGEIRDFETADLAVNAALTGHLVFSTLHTNDAAGSIPRLTNMGVPPFLINASLIGVMAQRLVRKLCQHCKESYEPNEMEKDLIRGAYNPADYPDRILMYRGRGCKFCNHLGYRGRNGIFEIMPMTNEMRNLVMRSSAIHEVKKLARTQGMLTLWESGVKKVLHGTTSLEELLRVARPDYEEDAELAQETGGTATRGLLAEAAPTLAEVESFSSL